MIPRLIHQTWKDDVVPAGFVAWTESWTRLNPGFERILWTDRMLLDFVAEHYPDFLEIYCSYSRSVMRADAARCLLLQHFGGIYADLDTECLAPLEPLVGEDRLVLAHEPPEHWGRHQIAKCFLPFLLFNGIMASPRGHPFWAHLYDRMVACRHAAGVLDATGPFLLTGSYMSFEPKDSVAVYPCHLFNPFDADRVVQAPYGDNPLGTLATHYWAGTWYRGEPTKRGQRLINRLRGAYFYARHMVTRGKTADASVLRAKVDPAVLQGPGPAGDQIAILVPVRDAAAHIPRFLELVDGLDYPKEAIKLVFCEGDSRDDTWRLLQDSVEPLRPRFRSIVLTQYATGNTVPREARWKTNLQRVRREGLARVRNHLVDAGLDETDDWALWIDVDVWSFPRDIIQQLRAAAGRIVAPHCVVYPGGTTYDLNSFMEAPLTAPHLRYRYMKDGLHQPPGRLGKTWMDCQRHSERVQLDGVGGTMLLVDAALHRGGLRFPELPYNNLIETEGFGILARDLGVGAIGLPRVEVLHVPW